MRSKTLAVALTSAVLLAACGGGGDDSPAPAPAPTPSPAPSPSPSPTPAPAPATDRAATASELAAAKDEIAKTAALLSNEALRAIQIASFFPDGATGTCASLGAGGSGNYTVSYKDVNDAAVTPQRAVQTGDTVAVTFDNCRIGAAGAMRNGIAQFKVENATARSGTLTTFNFSIKETPTTTVTTSITDKTPSAGAAVKVDLSDTGDGDSGYTGKVTPSVTTDPLQFKITDTAATEKVFEVTGYDLTVGMLKDTNPPAQDDNATPALNPAVPPTFTAGTFKKTDPALTPAPTTITGSLN